MKKFFALTIFLTLICAQASALRLELRPQPIGKVSFFGEDFKIEGAAKISKHMAQFDEYFYFHFDAAKKISAFGDRKIKNTVNVDTSGETEIYRIKNTGGWDFYLLKKTGGTGDAIKVLGMRDDKWIEHLDTLALREKYNIGWNFCMTEFFTQDNKIIFRYRFQDKIIDVICRWHGFNQKFYTEVLEQ